jgi:hypothetical protein
MNERIKELAVQTKVMDVMMRRSDGYFLSKEQDIEKFAELIVKECARIAEEVGAAYVLMGYVVPHECSDKIKQHFGVTEEPFKYSEEYDSFYSESRNEWTEDKCSDPDCNYCINRPDRPLP